jgi:glycosyltransferase involved in cell wall biosynthesis
MAGAGRATPFRVTLSYSTDPRVTDQGGGVRYMRFILQNLLKREVRTRFIGVDLEGKSETGGRFELVPLLKNSNSWFGYLLLSILKVPFIRFESGELLHCMRVVYLLPYVIFHPKIRKVCTSDEPLVTASLIYPKPLYSLMEWLFTRIEGFILKRIDVLLVAKTIAEEYFIRKYPWLPKYVSMYETATGGVDTSVFFPMDRKECRLRLGFGENEKIILFVGRLAPVKRVDFLIDAFDDFQKHFPQSRFVIVGAGESEHDLRAYAKTRAPSSIDFIGTRYGGELVAIYSAADMLVLGSRTEGHPTVLFEALACGLPVVTSDTGDVRQMLGDNPFCRILSHPTHYQFAQAMREVFLMRLSLPLDACVEQAGHFSSENMFGQLFAIYENLHSTYETKGHRGR